MSTDDSSDAAATANRDVPAASPPDGEIKVTSVLLSAPEDDANDVTDGTINDGPSVVTTGFAPTHAEEANVATHDGHLVESNSDVANAQANTTDVTTSNGLSM